MAESIHDWAVKLNMIKDEESFTSAERLMNNFTNATIKQNERIKKSNIERMKDEQMAQMRSEGEKIRRKHTDPVKLANEDATKSMERLDELYIMNTLSADTYQKELEAIYASYLKIEAIENDRISQAGLAFQAENIEMEKARLVEMETLKLDILRRSAEEEERSSQRRLALIQREQYAAIDASNSSAETLAQMRVYYQQLEKESKKASAEKEQLTIKQAALEQLEYQKALDRLAVLSRQEEQYMLSKDKHFQQLAAMSATNRLYPQPMPDMNNAYRELEAANPVSTHSEDSIRAGILLEEKASQRRIGLMQREQLVAAERNNYTIPIDELNDYYKNLEEEAQGRMDEVQKLLRIYGDQTHIIAQDITRLKQAQDAGLITMDQYNEAISEASRRQGAMRRGAGNLGYAIGELARGAEDFITVMSITGYNVNSVGMAMRGASNNIGQAASLMGGPLLGSALSVAGILGGQLIASLWGTTKGFDAQATSLNRLTEEYIRFNKEAERQLALESNQRDISAVSFSVKDLDKSVKAKENDIPNLVNERDKLLNEHKAFRSELIRELIPTSDMRNISEHMKKISVFLKDEESGMAKSFENSYNDILNRFSENVTSGAVRFEDAVKIYKAETDQLDTDIRRFSEEVQNRDSSSIAAQQKRIAMGDKNIKFGGFGAIANADRLLKDGAKLQDQLEKQEKKLKEIADANNKIADTEKEINQLREIRQAKLNTFEVNELEPLYMKLQLAGAVEEWQQKEIESKHRLIELEKEYEELGADGLRIAKERWEVENKIKAAEEAAANQRRINEEMDNNEAEFEKLKAMSEEALLMSEMTKEQKIQYEWAKKRAEVMASGIAGPADLENIFKNNALARQNELEQQWKDSAPKMSIDTVSKIQALGDANAAIMGAMGESKDKAMIRELKAIKDAINNPRGGIKFVEVE